MSTQTLAAIGLQTQTCPSAALAQMTSKPQVTVLATQLGMALEAAQPSDTNMVTGCNLDSGHPCDLWWHCRPWTSTQTPAVVDHGPRRGPHQHPRLRGSQWPQMAVQVTQMGMVP